MTASFYQRLTNKITEPRINGANLALVSSSSFAVGILFTRIWKHLERARERESHFLCSVASFSQYRGRDCQAGLSSCSSLLCLRHSWCCVVAYNVILESKIVINVSYSGKKFLNARFRVKEGLGCMLSAKQLW